MLFETLPAGDRFEPHHASTAANAAATRARSSALLNGFAIESIVWPPRLISANPPALTQPDMNNTGTTASRDCVTGRWMVNVAPSPGFDATEIAPPPIG